MKLSIKFLLFSLPICCIIVIKICLFDQNQIKEIDKESIYFIGSSRVQRSIDPKLLNEHQQKYKTYNLGIAGSTFFHNIVLAKYLINEFKAKELFVELSTIKHTLHPTHLNLGIIDISKTNELKKHFQFIDFIGYIETYLFEKVSLKSFLKSETLTTKNSSKLGYGYIFEDKNNYFTSDSFLKIEDLDKKINYDVSEYVDLISELNQDAKKHNTKIHFFLPLTYRSQKEREIVSKIFQLLPNEQKVNYTESFFRDISNPDNLLDKNHLNNKGARIMTTYFKNTYFID